MNIEEIREFCLQHKGVTENFPFDEVTLVFKVGSKMFLLANLDGELSINIKGEPERIIQLKEEYEAVLPGYHMNKKHWVTIKMDGSIKEELIKNWILESYQLVYNKLTRKEKEIIK